MAEALRPVSYWKIPGMDGIVSFASRLGLRRPAQSVPAAEPIIEQPVIEPAARVFEISPTAQGFKLAQDAKSIDHGTTVFSRRRREGVFQSFVIENDGTEVLVELQKGGTACLTDLRTLERSEQPFIGQDLENWRRQRITLSSQPSSEAAKHDDF